ncbi:ABC transporter permease subunit [Granulicatella sp. zg-ZJ]|uniref:ABC transporter permease n=1 Tax=Granulicatella sp. zg-ZJ TaxID=2678504 RepID=UPI0013D1595C|nr:ABC transporter permease [Granulicatella sp. zg-ZJ]NEW61819.1 ABC transporter permease subunit [Granulicatella sp. zg-ZJ]
MLKKCLSFFVALLLISILTFLLTKLSSQDPAESYLRISKIGITAESLANAREYLGLNKSWLEQYLDWLSKAIVGNFGNSYLLKLPVLPLVATSFLSTLYLGSISFILVIVISLPLGVLTGIRKHSILDRVIQFFCFSSVSVPTFWLGYLLIILFAVQLKWLPVSGKGDITSVILPSVTLSIPIIGQYIALIRKVISEQMDSVHVQNAMLRGVKMSYIIKHHLLRNALPAIVTGLSLTFIYLITGSLIIEEVFAFNGIGGLFVHALQSTDIPIIQACMLLFGSLFLVNNLVVHDITLWIDPRIRKRGETKHV